MTEERWLARARTALDEQAEALDGTTRSRLTRARARALRRSAAARPLPPGARWLLAPALAAALVAVLLATLPLEPDREMTPGAPALARPASAEDLELLAAEADLEFLADLEFYLWLEDELAAADAG